MKITQRYPEFTCENFSILSILTVGNFQQLWDALCAMNHSETLHSAARCLVGVMALTVITLACFLLGLKFSTVGFVYLVVIVLVSLTGDLFSSTVCSIVGKLFGLFFCLSTFFH